MPQSESSLFPERNSREPDGLHLTPHDTAFLRGLIHRDSGIVLDETKRYLIESRLLPILHKTRSASFSDLCARLRGSEAATLRQQVVEAITTNETLFFRDPAVFAAIRENVLPVLIQTRRTSRTLSIWSAAASTGQEAYSIAMLLLEAGLAGWNLRILGTDLNTQVLQQARTGWYSSLEVNRGVPAAYRTKFFFPFGNGWQVRDDVRRYVHFRCFDLRESMRSLGDFDLVLCRNVLIYFDEQTKKQVLGELRQVVKPQGLLVLGCAETMLNLDQSFSRRVIGQSVFYAAQ